MRGPWTPRRTHIPKGIDHVRALRVWLADNPDATVSDRRVAENELANLLDALGNPEATAADDERPDPRIALALTRALLDTEEPAAEIVREHAAQFGEVLPTVLLADLARWYTRAVDDPTDRASAGRVVGALRREFARGDDTMRAVIATGFLEALTSEEAGGDMTRQLPRRLRRELEAMQHRPALRR